MANSYIHPFYRIWMTWIDPAVSLATTITCFLQPEKIVASAIPIDVSPLDSYQIPVIQMIGGLFLQLVILSAVLLRQTNDVGIWRTAQLGILFVDIAILYALYYALAQQDRLTFEKLRPEDWSNFVLTTFVAVVRLLFVVGVGVRSATNAIKKTT